MNEHTTVYLAQSLAIILSSKMGQMRYFGPCLPLNSFVVFLPVHTISKFVFSEV